jgi:hypothetical protein
MALRHVVFLILVLDGIARLFEATVGVKRGQIRIVLWVRLGLVLLGYIRILTKAGGEF